MRSPTRGAGRPADVIDEPRGELARHAELHRRALEVEHIVSSTRSTPHALTPFASFSRVVERFGHHRGYLYFCALGGSLLARGLIHPAPP